MKRLSREWSVIAESRGPRDNRFRQYGDLPCVEPRRVFPSYFVAFMYYRTGLPLKYICFKMYSDGKYEKEDRSDGHYKHPRN
jgi:hypothetical protein